MVKTDIEYATLYAALLLRLRNPREEDFKLTWRLQDGDCAALHAPLTARPAAAARAREEPAALRPAAAQRWRARWRAMLGVAAQDALAASLVDDGAALAGASECCTPPPAELWAVARP